MFVHGNFGGFISEMKVCFNSDNMNPLTKIHKYGVLLLYCIYKCSLHSALMSHLRALCLNSGDSLLLSRLILFFLRLIKKKGLMK